MPAAPSPRQAAVSPWFEMAGAQAMRDWEQRHLLECLQGVPSQPWLWLAPSAVWLPQDLPAGRGLRLHASAIEGAHHWNGDLRCGHALPLPSETFNAIVIQHAPPEHLA